MTAHTHTSVPTHTASHSFTSLLCHSLQSRILLCSPPALSRAVKEIAAVDNFTEQQSNEREGKLWSPASHWLAVALLKLESEMTHKMGENTTLPPICLITYSVQNRGIYKVLHIYSPFPSSLSVKSKQLSSNLYLIIVCFFPFLHSFIFSSFPLFIIPAPLTETCVCLAPLKSAHNWLFPATLYRHHVENVPVTL